MASDFGTDKNQIDNYKHCENASLKLSIPPHELLNLVSSSTEESSRLFMWLSIEKERKKQFVSKVDQESFEIRLKSRVRGHQTSYAPWLHGEVIPAESGCEVTVWFKLDDLVRWIDKVSRVMLWFFSLLFLLSIMFDLMSSLLDFETFFFLLVLCWMWFGSSHTRNKAMKLAEKDKEILCHFLMELINPYKIDNESNN